MCVCVCVSFPQQLAEKEGVRDKGEIKREREVVCCIYGASLGEGGSHFWPHFSLIQLLLSLPAALSLSLLQPAVCLLLSSSEGASRDREGQDVQDTTAKM